MVIAKLLVKIRYSISYVPEGVCAELCKVVFGCNRILTEHNAASNRIQRWFKIYFPEYLNICKTFDAEGEFLVL